MHSFTAFLLTVSTWAWTAKARSSGFFPMSPRQGESEPQVLSSAVHPFFTSPNNGAIIDIAVPEEQRLYGRDYRGTIEGRPIAHGVQNIRKYFNPLRTRGSERLSGSSDSAKESSLSERMASNLTLPSLGYRPPPPPVRRDVGVSPRCQFDADKWALHMESTLTYAIMFDRKTGGSCKDCLDRCMEKQGGSWTCRSVVYDSKWRICDMFAVAATAAPFTLVDYEGRDYYEYLAALPPSDAELSLVSNFAEQQQTIAPDSKEKQMCSEDRDKVSGSKTHVVELKTYSAVPIEEQLKADERELEKIEKERGKKERKLQKIIKENEAVTVPSTTTDAQVPLTEDKSTETADYERTTLPVREDDSSDSSTTSPSTEIVPDVEQTTIKIEVIPPAASRSIRRKPPKNIKGKKTKNDSQRRRKQPLPVQSRSDVNDEETMKEEAHSIEQSQRRRMKKIVGRKPSKVVKTNSMVATTTEVIQELSPELAREKILLYQKRKAAEAEQTTSAPRRRRVRIEGRRLHGDVVEEDEQITRDRDVQEVHEKYRKKVASRTFQGSHNIKQNLEKENERKPVKKGLSRRKIPLHQTTPQPSSSTSTPSTVEMETSAVATTEPGSSEDALRMALAREIKKFISKELKHQLFRAHGTRLHGESEELKPPSELVPMSSRPRARSREEEVLPSNICEEHEKVVMMTFADSTRKPYTAAVEMVKTADHEECMRLCERSPDCSSAVFSSSLCEMSATRARHTIPDIRPSTNDTYIEKACVDSAVIRGRETHIEGVANHILAGFVEQVEDAYGVEQCIAACYMALKQYGFHCMSAMWYPLDKEQSLILGYSPSVQVFQNCLLNGESRKTQQKLFIAEDTGHQMIYFEHPDAAIFRRMHDEIPLDQNSTAEHDWTAWSLCQGKEERVRYLRCKEHSDVRKCPKETAKCQGVPNASSAKA
ncbi:hypothetical protein ANCCAN_06051 [Ancylostoma caninum]|uniref:Apple domain-containing protein n=1 Tax=Ancylostoma caninum TaxID=29170 RepID=A0A368GXY9_ANCCA|nr:hypothetical protein ANCCAN_06051 [Ancylostoma caninum]